MSAASSSRVRGLAVIEETDRAQVFLDHPADRPRQRGQVLPLDPVSDAWNELQLQFPGGDEGIREWCDRSVAATELPDRVVDHGPDAP